MIWAIARETANNFYYVNTLEMVFTDVFRMYAILPVYYFL